MLLETLGIASIIPLINYLTGTSSFGFIDSFIEKFTFQRENLILPLVIIIFIIFFFKNIYLSFYYWVENKFSYETRFKLGTRLYSKYLSKPFSFHSDHNSSMLMTKIVQETAIFGSSLMALCSLITELFIIFGLIILLLLIKPLETSIIILIILTLGLIFYLLSKKISFKLGKELVIKQKDKMKVLKESLNSIKEIIIFDAKNYFKKIFFEKSMQVANYGYKMSFLNRLPKIWFELGGILIISAILLLSFSRNNENLETLGTIGIFLLTSLKIIPSVNKILVSLQTIKYSETANRSLYQDSLDFDVKEFEEDINYKFEKFIDFKNVNFQYKNSDTKILEKINLQIKKGEFIAIIGESGSGKTTLINLLTGLLKPTHGEILVDDVKIEKNFSNWRKKIGFVPQNINLLDDTLKKNIAYGLDDNLVSKNNLDKSISLSQLSNFVSQSIDSYNLKVGESGEKISGGQKQRVGIARALYNDPEILIFDEPTSSLDPKKTNELFLMLKELNKSKTIIVVSHDIDDYKFFDNVYEIKNNSIKNIKS